MQYLFTFFVLCATFILGSCEEDDPFRLLFESSWTEQTDLIPLEVSGTVPTWLSGSFIRNAPGAFEMGKRNLTMAFDGYAKLFEWNIDGKNGKVQYRTRFQESHWFNSSKRQKDISASVLFGSTDPPENFMFDMERMFAASDNRNVNVWQFGDTKALIADMTMSYHLDDNLRAAEPLTFNDGWTNASKSISCAHPQHMPTKPGTTKRPYSPNNMWSTHDSINYFCKTNPFGTTACNLIRIDKNLVRHVIPNTTFTFPFRKISYMHSFGLTDTHAILFGYPLYYGFLGMMMGQSVSKSFRWMPEDGVRVFVIALDGSGVTELHSDDSFFCFHTINAFNDGDGEFVIDLTETDVNNVLHPLVIKDMRNRTKRNSIVPQLEVRRYRVNTKTSSVTYEPIDMKDHEKNWDFTYTDLPQLNMGYRGKEYCVFYGLNTNSNFTMDFAFNAAVKKNVCDNSIAAFSDTTIFSGEPVFAARPGAEKEDDGVVLLSALDTKSQRTALIILDASNMKELARAYVPADMHLPFGIHGQFFSNE